MTPIQPINIWKDGQNHQANAINVQLIQDNLKDTAVFRYSLIDHSNDDEISDMVLCQGNLMITGEQYEQWGQDQDVNLGAYVWVCQQLNVTMI